ncbi:MAG: argininosuccinate lyase [Candidatus Eisenbacteria bacterium RBG_16_71_46]|nr:MAG: argininosuccinate lyase [Candidatus Eisenbacteria bacterium RBG_16_71_46]
MSAERPAPEVWRGRLAAPLDPRARVLNDSLPVDRRLWPEELALSRAYARTLAECAVLDEAGLGALLGACDALEEGLLAGATVLAGEDVHSAVEAELVRRAGDAARRLHTGRSRNDQVATLLRMRAMGLCEQAVEHVRELERALARQARAAGDIAVPAFTHLQPAQPVLLAHVWLAHVAAFERDEERFLAAREAADLMPLGASAVAGTPLRYDRVALATRLGFSRLATNSLDAVGDRDFAIDYLNAAAALGIHLSRLAEDLVLWCSPAFGWFIAPDGFSTGSSLLPQKRNPDIFELARAKSARLIANAQRLHLLLKGLPSSYQKDLQEDKEAVFDTADTLDALLDALPPAIAALEPEAARMRDSLTPDLLAVELADALVAEGVPFRDAHAAVSRLWAAAERAGVPVSGLPEIERLAISPLLTGERLADLDVTAAIARRDQAPGTGPGAVAAQLARVEGRLGLGPGDAAHDQRPQRSGTGARVAQARRRQEPGAPETRTGCRPSPPPAGRPSESSEAEPWMAEPSVPRGASPAAADAGHEHPIGEAAAALEANPASASTGSVLPGSIRVRPARITDVPGIAALMAEYVIQGVLLPRPVSELYQCVREFHVAECRGEVVACAALRLLWEDLGEVRSLAVRPDHHGRGLGVALVRQVIADARALSLPRVIALTREVPFFERCGFGVLSRDALPRKVWTDCVRCPRRHACDEVAVVLDLVPGASAAAAASGRSWTLPIPQTASADPASLPIVT